MKEFQKNQEDHFICEECGKVFELLSSLMSHASRMHGGKLNYYTKIKFFFFFIINININKRK